MRKLALFSFICATVVFLFANTVFLEGSGIAEQRDHVGALFSVTTFQVPPLLQTTRQKRNSDRYVIFVMANNARGQGLGNIMNGLAAAMLLARKYKRQVCVDWPSFNFAFPVQLNNCSNLVAVQHTSFWNFGSSDPRSRVHKIFQSREKVISFSGNEYPDAVFPPLLKGEFKRHFFPRTSLLPFASPRECVLHIRKGDGSHDIRSGTGVATLVAAAKSLPPCHLVTNNVRWQSIFEPFGWTFSQTEIVVHSSSGGNEKQLWADWITLAHAKHLTHTKSAFSESAIRMSGAHSRILWGSDGNTLLYSPETWEMAQG